MQYRKISSPFDAPYNAQITKQFVNWAVRST